MPRPHPDRLDLGRRAALRAAALLPLGLAGCGFRMRQPVQFAFKSIYAGVAPTSPLGAEFKRYLAALGNVELITDPARQQQAQVILDVLQELRENVVVGYNAAGQVREVQLRLRFKFRLRTPQGKELIPDTEILQQRDQTFSETFVLAKLAEQEQLYRSMQSDIVQQLLRQLAAVKEL